MIPLGLFLIAWIYPLKIFNETGILIGMHRQALKASGFFIFTSVGITLDEIFTKNIPAWGEPIITIILLLLAILIYKLMLHALSKKITEHKNEVANPAVPIQ